MNNKAPFIIYSESTPNPAVMKFVANKMLTKKSKEFFNTNETNGWPLLNSIFSFPFVKEIFIANNYISIKKHDTIEWADISNQMRIFIQDQLNKKTKVCVLDISRENPDLKIEKSQLMSEIEELIQLSIRPNIQMDGGDIELVSCENGIVKLFLKGACSGCPSSQMTLKNGIEVLLKDKFPGKIKEVVAINN